MSLFGGGNAAHNWGGHCIGTITHEQSTTKWCYSFFGYKCAHCTWVMLARWGIISIGPAKPQAAYNTLYSRWGIDIGAFGQICSEG